MKSSILLVLLPLFPLLVLTAPVVVERDINAFLAEVALLFPFSGLIQDISGLLTVATAALAAFFGLQTTQNGLSGACAPVTIIFARGTTEPGNVGAVAGPPFFDALKAEIGSNQVSVQGVSYPASVEGFLAGGHDGAQNMANFVTQAFSQCPSTKVIMSGYSQGSQVVHNAASLLPASTMQKVSSVILFGDPDNGAGIANVASSKTLVICHFGDDICLHGDLILLAHLTYAANAVQAANFAASKAGY